MVLLLKKQRLAYNIFSSMGLKAHEFEAYLDYKAANPDKKILEGMYSI